MLLALWLVAAGWGIHDRAGESIDRQLPGVAARGNEQMRRLRGYLQTGDRQYLVADSPLAVPYPNPDFLRSWLDDAFVRSILPRSLRSPPVGEASVGAVGSPSISDTPGHLAPVGQGFLIGGAACWGLAALLLWRSRVSPG